MSSVGIAAAVLQGYGPLATMTGEHLEAILKVAGAKAEKDGWQSFPRARPLTLHVAHDGAGMTVSRDRGHQAGRRARLRPQPEARALRSWSGPTCSPSRSKARPSAGKVVRRAGFG